MKISARRFTSCRKSFLVAHIQVVRGRCTVHNSFLLSEYVVSFPYLFPYEHRPGPGHSVRCSALFLSLLIFDSRI